MAPPEICPNCGAEVPRNAKSCPECGSSEETGWSEQARTDGLGLPEEEFDHQDFVEREFGGKRSRPRGITRFWWVVAIVALVLFFVLLLR